MLSGRVGSGERERVAVVLRLRDCVVAAVVPRQDAVTVERRSLAEPKPADVIQ